MKIERSIQMRYTVQSGKYVFKNILYIFPLAVVPAFFLALSTDPAALKSVLQSFFNGAISEWKFGDLFSAVSVLNFNGWNSMFGFIGLVALMVCVSMLTALMEKHMRFGKRTFNGLFSKLNDNLLATCGYGLLLIAIYELWALIMAALLLAVSCIPLVWLACAFSFIVMIMMHFALLYCVGLIYLWLPCMHITGFPAAEALQYSNQLSKPAKWRILLSQTVFLFAVETLIFLSVLLTGEFTFTIVSTILYAFLIMIYCVRMQVVYFDLDGIERRDLRKYYQHTR